ncbi:MAG: serine/threonine protein kinase, partial [Planctomycetia bacterium]|nr:serine/threonine protein kinase [Planctomycetia bacterium]
MAYVDEFLRNLEKSNLLNAEQWAAARREIAAAQVVRRDGHGAGASAVGRADGPRELAVWLVEKRFVTRWQADMLLAGKKAFFLGKYRLLDCIGTGGMGAVFKALHVDMGRTVAVKILSAEVMKNRHAVARFRQEIQAVAALDDPHIVAAYDAGNERGTNYLVMEYVEGHDLGHLVKHNSPLPIPWACDCVRQAALGLQHAHEQGMVHRDIKPTNLLVTKDDEGRPLTKILDLGLARFVSEMVLPESVQPVPGNGDGSLTQIGEFLGTPDYIAPEQAHDTRAADIRSDIFSLGCTLFRLLTAELPFGGESVLEKLEAREKTAARRVRDLRPDVPAELEVVVARMLARDPRERYQTPREVAQALAPFTGKAVSLPRPALRPAPTVAPTSPGENTLLEQIFRSLATEAADQPMSFATVALRPNRRSPRVAIVIVVLAGLAGFAIWERNSAAILVIDWLLTEREGASLSVAGRVIRLPAEQTFRVSGRAGAWEIHASRDGFEPIDETKMLGRGERGDFSPRWRATPATARRNELSILEARVAEAVGADPLASASAELRGKILAYAHRYPGSREAATAGALLSRLRWPLDLLDGSKVPGDERREFSRFAGDQSGATLAAFFGESR